MLEWVCPNCNRAVDPSFNSCPFCEAAEARAEEAKTALGPVPQVAAAAPPGRVVRVVRRVRRVREPFQWADVERGFRFGLGFLAAVACGYFVLFLVSFYLNKHEWVEALGRFLYRH